MPPFHHSKRVAITSLFLYIKRSFFYTKFYQNMHQNAGNISQNFLGKLNTLYSNRASKIISFYIKMTIFGNNFKKHLIKIYTNTHQIAPFFKNFP